VYCVVAVPGAKATSVGASGPSDPNCRPTVLAAHRPGVRHEPSDADRAARKGRALSKVNLFLGCRLRYRWCAWLDLLRGPRTAFEMHKTGLGCVRVFVMEMWKHMI
jgi:hypothetical protein